MNPLLEIACFNSRSAEIAQEAGADRIELAENYFSGGTTASDQSIQQVLNKLKIPVHLLIRPRAGNYVYNQAEIERMKRSILKYKSSGISAFVIGALTESQEVDAKLCLEMMELANPLSCYFHRAIDDCRDQETALKTLISLNFKGVLSSGGKGTALEGKVKLKELQNRYGHQLEILAGGGIRSANIVSMMDCACPVYHSAALLDGGEFCNSQEIRKMKNLLTTL